MFKFSILSFIFFVHNLQRALLLTSLTNTDDYIIYFKNQGVLALLNLTNHITGITDDKLKDKLTSSQCKAELAKALQDKSYQNILLYSGHGYFKLGNSYQCNKNNFTYVLLSVEYGDLFAENLETLDIESKINFFVSRTKVNMGLCLWKSCEELLPMFFNSTQNTKFYEYVYNSYKVISIDYYAIIGNDFYSFSGKIAGSIVLMYWGFRFILKICCWLLIINEEDETMTKKRNYEKIQNKNDKKIKKEKKGLTNSEEIDYTGINEEEESNIKEEENEKKIIPTPNKETPQLPSNKVENPDDYEEEEEEDNDNESKIQQNSWFDRDEINISNIRNLEKYITTSDQNNNIISCQANTPNQKTKLISTNAPISFRLTWSNTLNNINDNILYNLSLKSLLVKNSCLYNSSFLEPLNGVRTVVLLLYTLNQTFEFFRKSPTNGSGTVDFYNSFYFAFIKLSSYSLKAFIFLDGFTTVFHLMNYIKKDQSAICFFRYYLSILPKIFVYFFWFFFVYYITEDIAIIFGKTTLFQQHYDYFFYKTCLSSPIYSILPFIFGYTQDEDIIYISCFQFSFLFVNEFLCFTLLVILFYLLYRFKSHLLDIIITLTVFINIVLTYFSFLDSKVHEEPYIWKYVMGEETSIHMAHWMFNIYFIGIICGLIYYYYIESMQNIETYFKKNLYYPFSYTMKIMHILLGQHYWVSWLICILSMSSIVLMCWIYSILKYVFLEGKYEFIIKNKGYLNIYYIYETPIFIMLFALLILELMFANDKFPLKSLLGSNIFSVFERICFEYICLMDVAVMVVFTLLDINGLYWDYLYIWYFTSFEFVVFCLISLFITLFFELPIKFAVRNINGHKKAIQSRMSMLSRANLGI